MSGTGNKQAPNVLISGVCLGQPEGGVRRHNAELLPRVAKLLEERGGRLAVLEGRVPITFDLPASIERIPSRVPWLPAPMRAVAETSALAAAIESARRDARPFHLVHTAHQPTPRALPIPFTLTIHDLRSLDLDRSPFVRRLIGGKVLARATTEARRIFTVSSYMRDRIAREFPAAASKIDVIGNGADHFHPLQRRPRKDDPFIVHVGHIEPRKNLDLLVRALHAAPHLPRLVLAGRPKGNTQEEILQLASQLGVAERVQVEDGPSDARIAELYSQAAAAVFPSRLEGHGIGPLEAIRAGCPVAASDIDAHRENLGKRAPLFAIDDAEGCVGAITECLGQALPSAEIRVPSWDECAIAFADSLCRSAHLL